MSKLRMSLQLWALPSQVLGMFLLNEIAPMWLSAMATGGFTSEPRTNLLVYVVVRLAVSQKRFTRLFAIVGSIPMVLGMYVRLVYYQRK
jgi:hypothetical protein